MALNQQEIEAEAAAIAGVDRAAADGEFSSNLRIAIDSANEEAALSPAGEEAVREELLLGIANRFQTDRWFVERPEIADEQISKPLFLSGLPRSGTTCFQYLFDNDPAMRLLRTWETARPAPTQVLTDEERQRRKALADEDGANYSAGHRPSGSPRGWCCSAPRGWRCRRRAAVVHRWCANSRH